MSLQSSCCVRFFFCLFITRMRPIRSWRGYIQSVSCLLSAQWRHAASSPFALLLRLSQEDVKRTKGSTNERKASVTGQGKNKGKQQRETAQRLHPPCGRHEIGRGKSASPPAPGSSAPAPCSSNHSRASSSDTALTASST